jgi:hypothetical protein
MAAGPAGIVSVLMRKSPGTVHTADAMEIARSIERYDVKRQDATGAFQRYELRSQLPPARPVPRISRRTRGEAVASSAMAVHER